MCAEWLGSPAWGELMLQYRINPQRKNTVAIYTNYGLSLPNLLCNEARALPCLLQGFKMCILLHHFSIANGRAEAETFSLSDFLQGCWAKHHLQTGEWMSCKWCHWFETERGHDVGECSWCWVFSKGFWIMRHDWMTCVFFKSWVGESWIIGLLLFLLDVCGLRTWLSIFSADAKIILPILGILRAVSCRETGMLFQPWALLFGSLKPSDVKINNF